MADEVGLNQNTLEALSISNKNVEAALMLLAETLVDHKNTLVTLSENKKDSGPIATTNLTKTGRNPLNALSRNLHGLVRELKKSSFGGNSELTSIMRSLNTNLNVMQSSIQSVANSNKELIGALNTSSRVASKKHDDDFDPDKFKRDNLFSYQANKSLRYNPWIRYASPKMASRLTRIAGFADFAGQMGLTGTSKYFGHMARGAALGKIGALGTIGLSAGILGATGYMLKESIKRFAQSTVSAVQMQGRTGRSYGVLEQERFRSAAQAMGYNQDEVFKRQHEYARYGIKDTGTVLSGLAAEKLFGLSNTPQFFQRLVRSTNYASTESRKLGLALFNLQHIVKNTSMGMDEVAQHQNSFMDAFRGQTTQFNYGQTTGLLENFKDLLNSYELSGQDIGSFYNASQRVDLNTLVTGALFASRGGYNFKTSGGLLDQAYELRRMGSGDMVNRAKVLQAELKGLYNTFGVNKFQQLSGQQKLMVTEQMMPSLLGIDVSKLPSAEQIIKTLESGARALTPGSDVIKELNDAKKTDIEAVVTKMSLISDPLNSIKGLLFSWVAGGKSAAKLFINNEQSNQTVNKDNNVKVDLNVFKYVDDPIAIEPSVPGKGASVNVKTLSR